MTRTFNGAGGTSWIPAIGRNTYKYPRDIVHFRLQKLVHITERVSGEARADLFNMYNHQNVTAVTSTAYVLSSSGAAASTTATATYQSTFGTVTNSNSSGFLYTRRQVPISFRLLF